MGEDSPMEQWGKGRRGSHVVAALRAGIDKLVAASSVMMRSIASSELLHRFWTSLEVSLAFRGAGPTHQSCLSSKGALGVLKSVEGLQHSR